jgi:hypothetical protein
LVDAQMNAYVGAGPSKEEKARKMKVRVKMLGYTGNLHGYPMSNINMDNFLEAVPPDPGKNEVRRREELRRSGEGLKKKVGGLGG